jgi:hypothetical protein
MTTTQALAVAPVSDDECCFRPNRKQLPVAVEGHGWITYSVQARGFYKRQGYAVFGILDDYPPGQKGIFLHKVLVA